MQLLVFFTCTTGQCNCYLLLYFVFSLWFSVKVLTSCRQRLSTAPQQCDNRLFLFFWNITMSKKSRTFWSNLSLLPPQLVPIHKPGLSDNLLQPQDKIVDNDSFTFWQLLVFSCSLTWHVWFSSAGDGVEEAVVVEEKLVQQKRSIKLWNNITSGTDWTKQTDHTMRVNTQIWKDNNKDKSCRIIIHLTCASPQVSQPRAAKAPEQNAVNMDYKISCCKNN